MSTYTKLVNHFVFSTKGRHPWLGEDIRTDVLAYIGGIIRNQRCASLIVNGAEDHVHILAHVRPSLAVSDLMRHVKGSSSEFIHDKFRIRDFTWQEGFFGISVRGDEYEHEYQYIENQVEHHRKELFEAELRRLVIRAGIDFQEAYLLG